MSDKFAAAALRLQNVARSYTQGQGTLLFPERQARSAVRRSTSQRHIESSRVCNVRYVCASRLAGCFLCDSPPAAGLAWRWLHHATGA